MSPQSLAGYRVLVTRPVRQAQVLCQLVARAGGTALHVPTLRIEEIEFNNTLATTLAGLDAFDLAIFTSANAVERGLTLVGARGLPPSLKLAAIGRATSCALASTGYTGTLVPTQHFTSEALLEQAEMQEVVGKNILIFRGSGGREVLGERLAARGAKVSYAEVYRRVLPWEEAVRLNRFLSQAGLDLVMTTSQESLTNLVHMTWPALRESLKGVPIVAGGERVSAAAREAGFATVITAEDPTDQTMFDTLLNWVSSKQCLKDGGP